MEMVKAEMLMAFWSKGRKEFLPLTAEEFERRANADKDTRASLAIRGFMKSKVLNRGGAKITIYEITPKGIGVLSWLKEVEK